jgi:uncharacterized protein YqeY
MTTLERLREDMKTAMRAKDSLRLNTVRMLIADLKNREIDKRAPLDESEVVDALVSTVKKRKDVIAEARAAGRPDVAEREEAELKLVEVYLPQGLGEAEIKALVEAAVAESGAKSPQEMGKVMKLLMPQVKGKADGKLVNDLVKARLGG